MSIVLNKLPGAVTRTQVFQNSDGNVLSLLVVVPHEDVQYSFFVRYPIADGLAPAVIPGTTVNVTAELEPQGKPTAMVGGKGQPFMGCRAVAKDSEPPAGDPPPMLDK